MATDNNNIEATDSEVTFLVNSCVDAAGTPGHFPGEDCMIFSN